MVWDDIIACMLNSRLVPFTSLAILNTSKYILSTIYNSNQNKADSFLVICLSVATHAGYCLVCASVSAMICYVIFCVIHSCFAFRSDLR